MKNQTEGLSSNRHERWKWLVPIAVSLAFLIEQLDNTAVATAIPAIAADLGALPTDLSLLLSAYILAIVMFMPLSGWLADRYGARAVFSVAIVIFTFSSLACSQANSIETLVIFRIFQGVGGALMTPVGRLVLIRTFAKHELVAAMSLMTAPALIGPLVGPLVSGAILAHASWRWIFVVNLPIGCIALVCALLLFTNDPSQTRKALDLKGLVFVIPALITIQLSIEVVAATWYSVWIALVATVVVTTLFIAYTRHARQTAYPILEFALFRIRAFRTGALSGGLVRVALNTVPFLIPLQLQLVLKHSPLVAGALISLGVVGALIMKPLNGYLLRRYGFRKTLSVATLMAAALVAAFAAHDIDTSIYVLAVHITALGLVRTILFNSFNILIFSNISDEQKSGSVSLAGLVQQLSMGLGISLGAMALTLAAGGGALDNTSFAIVFVLAGALALPAAISFARLQPSDE